MDSFPSWRFRFGLEGFADESKGFYYIQPANASQGEAIPFVAKPEQEEILEAIYERGELAIAIIKARQLGFSTLLALICLDMTMFRGGFLIGIVDQTAKDAEKKLQKVLFAWERLPDDVKSCFEIRDTVSEFQLRIKPDKKNPKPDAWSTIYAGMRARGGTHHLLWISEWGPIQATDKRRSQEIADGALPSAKEGIKVVETTWRGGRVGRLYSEVVEPSLTQPPEYWTREDWKIYFFGWQGDPSYQREGDVAQISADCAEYFVDLAVKHGIELSDAQKLWYFKHAWTKGNARFEEFPTILDEVFFVPVAGAIYADLVVKSRIEGRVCDFEPSGAPVYTTWDIGNLFNSTVVYWECHGLQWRVIDVDIGLPLELSERVAHMKDKEYNYGGHLLPHDANAQKANGLTFKKECEAAGLKNVQIIKAVAKVEDRINLVKRAFPSVLFRRSKTERLLEALEQYAYKESTDGSGYITQIIQQGWMCHPSDAFGQMMEAQFHNMISPQQNVTKKWRKPKVVGGTGY